MNGVENEVGSGQAQVESDPHSPLGGEGFREKQSRYEMQSLNKSLELPSTIRIGVGYAWAKGDGGETLDPSSDRRWQALRANLARTADAVRTRCESRPGSVKCSIDIRRLRATHGSMILDSIRDRISTADILVMDLAAADGSTPFSENVLLETGMALGMTRDRDRRLFVLSPNKDLPSDLQGVLRTDYVWDKSTYKFADSRGFHAALQGQLITLARERGMLGAARKGEVVVEGEDGNGKVQSAPTRSRK